jgi:hypothetical protein
MHKKSLFVKGISGICLSLLLISCGGANEADKKEESKEIDSLAENTKTETSSSADDVSYSLPSPTQIALILKKSGLKYYPGITNDIEENKNKATNEISKSLMLGVYSADLSYCVMNKQNGESKKYFKVCKGLAADLGLGQAFEQNQIAQRLEKNLDKEDSLLNLLSEVQMNSDNILEESDRVYIYVVSFAGAWVESMYIGMQVNMKERNINIDHKLVEQMSIGDNIVKALTANKNKGAGINDIITDIRSLSDIYNNFKAVKEIKAKDPDVIDSDKLDIGIMELLSFSKKIEDIRAKIIKG